MGTLRPPSTLTGPVRHRRPSTLNNAPMGSCFRTLMLIIGLSKIARRFCGFGTPLVPIHR